MGRGSGQRHAIGPLTKTGKKASTLGGKRIRAILTPPASVQAAVLYRRADAPLPPGPPYHTVRSARIRASGSESNRARQSPSFFIVR